MPRNITDRARELRKNMTDAERHLWQHLRDSNMGVAFRRQEPIGYYITDFIYYPKKLIVEVDGIQHLENPDDEVRDTWLRAQGFRVLRFWNNDVLQNTEGVLETIRRHLE